MDCLFSLDWVVHPIRGIRFLFGCNFFFNKWVVSSIIGAQEFFIIVKILVFLYQSMVTQEKIRFLEVFFMSSYGDLKKKKILGSSCFEIHGSTVMST